MNLTKRTVEAAVWHGRLRTADYRWDDDLSAFGLRIYPSGRKSFVVSYRARGRLHFHTLGQFGPMTVHEANTRALEVLGAVRRGDDPAGDRTSYRKAPTIADLAERFMREHARPKKKATQRYAHLAADPMRQAAERIGATIEAALAGRPKAPVVEIGRN